MKSARYRMDVKLCASAVVVALTFASACGEIGDGQLLAPGDGKAAAGESEEAQNEEAQIEEPQVEIEVETPSIIGDMFVPPPQDETSEVPFAALEETQVVFVNFGGGTFHSHPGCNQNYVADCSNAPKNKSHLVEILFEAESVALEGMNNAALINDTMTRLRAAFQAYDIEFTTQRPSSGPYTMAVVTPSQTSTGYAGLAPVDCTNRNPNDVVFILNAAGRNAVELSGTIAHELGHSFGLTHVEPLGDYMHYKVTGQEQSFTRARFDSAHASAATKCFDGDVQDGPQLLLEALGARGREHPPACAAVERISGTTRHETAVSVSQKFFPNGSDAVVLVRDSNANPDALAAGPLARAVGGPILMTATSSLPGATANEIQRLGPNIVYVIGGTGAVSDDVVREIQGRGYQVQRISGASRFDTAAEVARRVGPSDLAFIASAADTNLVDALAASGVAASLGAPILLATQDSLPEATRRALSELGVQRTVVAGGTGSISDAVLASLPNPTRVAGPSRFETAAELARWGRNNGVSTQEVFVARADVMVDALTAGSTGRATLLTTTDTLVSATESFLATYADVAFVLGGSGAISRTTEREVCRALGQ